MRLCRALAFDSPRIVPSDKAMSILKTGQGVLSGLFLMATLSFASSPEPAIQWIREWMETSRVLSREKAEWQAERQSLEESRALLQQQVARLKKALAAFEQEETASDHLRTTQAARREAAREAARAAMEQLGLVERRVLAMKERFPKPLQETLKPLYTRLEQAGQGSTLATRVQTVAGILDQASQFHATWTHAREIHRFGNEEILVDVLYCGLAQAWFVDAEGQRAGVARASDSGWVLQLVPDSAARIRKLIAVHKGEAEPELVALPMEVLP